MLVERGQGVNYLSCVPVSFLTACPVFSEPSRTSRGLLNFWARVLHILFQITSNTVSFRWPFEDVFLWEYGFRGQSLLKSLSVGVSGHALAALQYFLTYHPVMFRLAVCLDLMAVYMVAFISICFEMCFKECRTFAP